MGKYKTYEEYKPSSVDWLDECPKHWRIIRLKFGYEACLGKMLTSSPSSPEDTLEPYLRSANILWGYVDISDIKEMYFSPYEKEIYSLQSGDLVVSEGGDVGRAAIWRGEIEKCYIQNAVHRIRSKDGFSNGFLYYWLSFLKAAGYIDLLCSKATIAHLTLDKLCELPVYNPPFEEQKSIAHFLDRETTRIDTLITKKRQLIDLLHEKRDALVDSFVIKVPDPYEAIKKADMSWLVDLPSGWKNVRLKFLSSFITSGSRGWAGYYSDEGSIFLRISNLSAKSIDLDLADLQFVQPPEGAEGERTRVYPNDLLISITALIGAVGVVTSSLSEAYVNQHIALVRLSEHIHPRWAAYCVFSSLGQKQLGELTSGGTKDGLTLSDVGNLLVLIPPDKHQELYVKELDRKIDLIQLTILKTQKSIKTLEKYRTALITAAVTGKIDVREEIG